MIPLLVMAIAYLLGAIPFGYLLVKLKTGADVRSAGSGNIGATNVFRTTGRAVASFVGAFLYITPVALGATLVVFVAAVAWTRYISMGSIVAVATFPLAVWLLQKPPLVVSM